MNRISIEKARKILGKEAANMSDDQIAQLMEDLDVLAKYALKKAGEERMKNNRTPDNRDKKE